MVLNLFFPLVSLFLGSMIISSLCDHHDIGEKIFYSITGFPLLIAGLFYVIYFICQPRKDLVFNRMEQTVTLPGLLWMKPVIAGFDEIIVKATERQPSRANPVPGLLLGKPGTFLRHAELIGNPESDWSFYVWYMDRNRPLPPGSAFDEFRDRDKTRRRRDGSPPPLYGSDI